MRDIKLIFIISVVLVALLVGWPVAVGADDGPVEFFEGIDIITETLIDDLIEEIGGDDFAFDMDDEEEVHNIAVADFLNENDQMTRLSKYITEHIIINIMNHDYSDLRVLERQRLNSILEEQDRMTSGVLKRDTSEKIGELLGADYMIIGNFYNSGRKLQIIAKVVSIDTGYIHSAIRLDLQKNDMIHSILGESYIDRTLN